MDKMNHQAKYLGQRSLSSKVIVRIHSRQTALTGSGSWHASAAVTALGRSLNSPTMPNFFSVMQQDTLTVYKAQKQAVSVYHTHKMHFSLSA